MFYILILVILQKYKVIIIYKSADCLEKCNSKHLQGSSVIKMKYKKNLKCTKTVNLHYPKNKYIPPYACSRTLTKPEALSDLRTLRSTLCSC